MHELQKACGTAMPAQPTCRSCQTGISSKNLSMQFFLRLRCCGMDSMLDSNALQRGHQDRQRSGPPPKHSCLGSHILQARKHELQLGLIFLGGQMRLRPGSFVSSHGGNRSAMQSHDNVQGRTQQLVQSEPAEGLLLLKAGAGGGWAPATALEGLQLP